MTRDGMPRAYLRIDPNIDETHPDLDAFVRLLCAAARQPERGRFKDRALLDRALGRAKATKALAREDVVTLDDGRLYVEGWDEWQEGDHTVAERMRRMRARRKAKAEEKARKRDRVTVAPSPDRTDVTTDAVAKELEGSSRGDGNGDLPPNPPPAGGGRKTRANGNTPRAIAAAQRAADLEQERAKREERRNAEIWARRLTHYREAGTWDPAWGPEPEQVAS